MEKGVEDKIVDARDIVFNPTEAFHQLPFPISFDHVPFTWTTIESLKGQGALASS
jgi:hypothetical protein